jgi:serine/threonine-protein phosphatase 5
MTIEEMQDNVNRYTPGTPAGGAESCLWSDPWEVPENGFDLERNVVRGLMGWNFGPQTTKAFLDKNNLKLVIRSHEPLDDVHAMQSHHGGDLYTVFSSPDYAGGMFSDYGYLMKNFHSSYF